MTTLTEIDNPLKPMTWSKCFAVPGSDSILDLCHPLTMRSQIYGKTLADFQKEDLRAEIVNFEEHCKAKAVRQDAELFLWSETTEERYQEMLNVLPPAAQAGSAFLVGEAVDHHAGTGRPRFQCFKREDGKYFQLSAPITLAVFREMFELCTNDYVE